MRTRSLAAGWLAAGWLALVLLAGCGIGPGGSESLADYPAYETGVDLVRVADLVVRGVAVDSRVEMAYPELSTHSDPLRNPQAGIDPTEAERTRREQGVVVTVTRVRVTEVFDGPATVGDVLRVSQPGGELDGDRHAEAGTTMLSNRRPLGYVLFLSTYGGQPYHLLNPEQAMPAVVDGERLESAGGGPAALFGTLAEVRDAVAAARSAEPR